MGSTAALAGGVLAASAALAGCWGADDLPEVPPPPTAAQAPPVQPVRLEGSGDAAHAVALEPNRPVVLSLRASGRERFQLRLRLGVARSEILVFEHRGPVAGRAALWPGPVVGEGAQVVVRAEGRWSLEVAQPSPPADAAGLPGEVEGRGFDVIPVRIGGTPVGSISVSYGRSEPMVVELIPYERAPEGVPLFEGRGPVDERADFPPPRPGPYLLHVRALGRWRIAFGP